MGGRAVEGTGLENRQGRKLLVGSNPTPSARCATIEFLHIVVGTPPDAAASRVKLPPPAASPTRCVAASTVAPPARVEKSSMNC
jgi:hypothetical protein